MRRTRCSPVLLLWAAVSAMVAGPVRAEGRFRIDLEGGAAWQSRNTFAVPGDTGNREALADYDTGPYAAFRGTLTYRVVFTLSGFNTTVKEDVLLRVADLLTVNASMTVGGIAETVTVKSEIVTLDTASASLGQVVELKRIEELPMREGNPMELVVLAPRVANTTDLRFRKSGMTHSQSQFESDGTGEKRSDYAIDGVPNSSSFGGNQGVTVAYAPPAISVEEFRVQTSKLTMPVSATRRGRSSTS